MPESCAVTLVRAIGRWSMAALVINSIIGSGIFGLTSDLAKLLGNASPYAVLIAGAVYVSNHQQMSNATATSAGAHSWLKAILILGFAYGGFEGALTPMSEATNPRRDTTFGLFAALITCTALYTVIQWVVVKVLADPAHSERPLAEV